MRDDIRKWIAYIETIRPQMNALAQRLESYDATVRQPDNLLTVSELRYVATFQFDTATTTICFLLQDRQTTSDVVITNMTTLPTDQCNKGFGSKAIETLLTWAADNNLNEVRATQVNQRAKRFWQKNGFKRCPEPNPCNDFIQELPRKPA